MVRFPFPLPQYIIPPCSAFACQYAVPSIPSQFSLCPSAFPHTIHPSPSLFPIPLRLFPPSRLPTSNHVYLKKIGTTGFRRCCTQSEGGAFRLQFAACSTTRRALVLRLGAAPTHVADCVRKPFRVLHLCGDPPLRGSFPINESLALSPFLCAHLKL
jgi:hypothetical protein